MNKRIELLPSGHIQFRDIIDGQYHRSVIEPGGDTAHLPEKCDIVSMGDLEYMVEEDVKKALENWNDKKEIKEAIKEYKDKKKKDKKKKDKKE